MQHFLLQLFPAHPILLQSGQWLVDAVDKLVDMFKVLGHLCGEHHVNDGLSECSILIPGEECKQRDRDEKYDRVVNSINGCVNCFAILPAVAAAMNRFFVYSLVPPSPPLSWAGRHTWATPLWNQNHIILPLCATLTQTNADVCHSNDAQNADLVQVL